MKNLNSTDYQVLERIRTDSKISRTDLSIFFNLTPAAISKIIKKLISYNLIVESHSLQSTGGRPKKILKINSGYKKIIGINLGPEFIEVAISQLDGKLLEADKKYFTYKTQTKVVELLFQEISKMLGKYNINEIVGLGLALHGIVDNKEGISLFSPHFRWRELNIKELLEKLYKMPIIVENDVRAMAIAEHEFGSAEKLNSFVMLYISNGIGSSIVIDGKPFEGNTYSAGEIGHYVVKENSTTKCSCGKYGCLEAEFSDQAIKDKVSWYFEVNNIEQQAEDDNMKIIYKKAMQKKEPYYSIVKEASFEIGKALGNVLNVLNINSIFVCGDIISARNIFFDNFNKGMKKMLINNGNKTIIVKPTQLDDSIGVYGAFSLVITNLFKERKILQADFKDIKSNKKKI